MTPYDGLTGLTVFDKQGEVDKKFSIYQVVNGGFSLAK
jgi:hypothetical protein